MAYQPALLPSTADSSRLGYVGRKPGKKGTRDSDAWFTPPEYVASAREVMKGIDLDPFSSPQANNIVRASFYFTENTNAFISSWNVKKDTRVFMNPPYSQGLISRSIKHFLQEWENGSFAEGIVLVNNATDTKWFRAMIPHASAICFTDHRISFWNADGKRVSGNTRGQCFFYFGEQHLRFAKIFSKHGFILRHHP
jgi:phage N-6-adenine-methyltransferase